MTVPLILSAPPSPFLFLSLALKNDTICSVNKGRKNTVRTGEGISALLMAKSRGGNKVHFPYKSGKSLHSGARCGWRPGAILGLLSTL